MAQKLTYFHNITVIKSVTALQRNRLYIVNTSLTIWENISCAGQPFSALLAATAIIAPTAAQADLRITEFMYQGASSGNREFLELTNISNSSFDITGWSYNDDNPNNPVAFGNFFGSLAANESIILTEMAAADFRTY